VERWVVTNKNSGLPQGQAGRRTVYVDRTTEAFGSGGRKISRPCRM